MRPLTLAVAAAALALCACSAENEPATLDALQLSTTSLVPGQVVTATVTVHGAFELRQGTLLSGNTVVGEFKLIESYPDELRFSANTQWETMVRLRDQSAAPDNKPRLDLKARLIGTSGQTLEASSHLEVGCRLADETLCSLPEPDCVRIDVDPNHCGGCGNECVGSDVACAVSKCGMATEFTDDVVSCDYVCARYKYGGRPMGCSAMCAFNGYGGSFGQGSLAAYVKLRTGGGSVFDDCSAFPAPDVTAIACCCVALF